MDRGKVFLVLFFIGFLIFPVGGQVNVTLLFQDSDGDPISNVSVSIGAVENQTDANGYVTFLNLSDPWLNFTSDYPSSQYSAVIENVTVTTEANLDGFITASLRLRNTLGQSLEGQDCAVYATSTAGDLIHSWDTECTQGEPYLDDLGNWAAASVCPRTDSRGIYVFKGLVEEGGGFVFGTEYVLILHCNDVEESGRFNVTIPRRTDVSRRFYDLRLNAGVWVALIIAALIVISIAVLVLRAVIHKSK